MIFRLAVQDLVEAVHRALLCHEVWRRARGRPPDNWHGNIDDISEGLIRTLSSRGYG